MAMRIFYCGCLFLFAAGLTAEKTYGQTTFPQQTVSPDNWRKPGEPSQREPYTFSDVNASLLYSNNTAGNILTASSTASATYSARQNGLGNTPVAGSTKSPIISTTGSLSADAGQVWRTYNIAPFTSRIIGTNRPEQAVVDWVLRETGFEAWHNEPMGLLTADSRALRVYHTPQMQQVIADVVNRFNNSEAASASFVLHVISLDNTNWRGGARAYLKPVNVQTPGASAWILTKENTPAFLNELRKRSDFRELNSPYLTVGNGQATAVSSTRGKQYIRDYIARADVPGGFEAQNGQVDEGLVLDFSPLLSSDRRTIDAAVKCDIDQVEKLIPTIIELSASSMTKQRVKIETPQMAHFRFHERFHWPVDSALLIELGIVPMPVPVDGKPLVSSPFGLPSGHVDLLLLIEYRPAETTAAPITPRTPETASRLNRGRY